MQSAAALAVLLVGVQHGDAANIVEGANKVEFSLLCDLVALAEAGLTLPPVTDAGDEAVADILHLNMSVSDRSWQEILKKKSAENDYHDTLPDCTKDPGGWAEMWPRWHKALIALKVEKREQDLAQAGLQKLLAEEAKALRAHLRPILAKVLKIEEARGNLQPALAKPDAKTVKQELQKAVFGAAGKTKSDVQHSDAFTMAGCTDYESCCDMTPGTGKAKSVAAVVACLCAKASGNAADGACGQRTGLSTAWAVASPVSITKITEAIAFCPGTTNAELTSKRLEAPLSGLTRQMKIVGTDGYFKEFKATKRSCEDSNGLCVKYTSFTVKDGKAFEDIPWVNTLLTLVTQIKQREKAAAQASFLAEQLIAEKDTAYSLAETAKQAANLVKVTSDGEGTGSKQQSEDCTTHQDNRTVYENTDKCEWEGKTDNKTDVNLKREKDRKHNKQRHQMHKKGQINSNLNYNPNAPRLLNENGKIMLAKIPVFSSIRNWL
uniref:Variant surface glycoprotein 1125.1776 n=1 Tax=Trypanosoma brucei TaxID=5691 RepID=A0A1J0R7V3_9TRYP|nr:variant surface glycoprotein 1125.1776 [Trypanosoma brucei]